MGVHLSHMAVSPHGGALDPLFGHSQRIAVRGFVNRDSLHPPPDLHPGKLFRRLMVAEGGGEGAGERNKALQDAIITRRKKRINAHLWCINGV